MGRLRPEKLHTQFTHGTEPERLVIPRRYTLTHSDVTGDLFLSVGPEHNRQQLAGWQARVMRDEVLGEWQEDTDGPALHVHCHVSGGLLVGTPRMRIAIFRRELPLVLEALRFGDRALYDAHPELDQAPVWVHFHATQWRYDRTEAWGTPAKYRLQAPSCGEKEP